MLDDVHPVVARYDAWDQHPWIAVSSAGHAIYSLHFFMMMTGILSAAYLVPKLTAKTGHDLQVSVMCAMFVCKNHVALVESAL